MAHDNYVAALKIFIHMIKCKFKILLYSPLPFQSIDEKNASLKQMYMDKFNQYEQRAKQIKKQALDSTPTEPENNGGGGGGGGGASAAAQKDKKK